MSKNGKRSKEPRLLGRLQSHFDGDPASLPVVQQQFDPHERPNLQLAIQEMVRAAKRQCETVGVVTLEHYNMPSLARLSRHASAESYDEGPIEHFDVALHGDQHLSCVKNGLYLIREGKEPLAMLVTEQQHWAQKLVVEVMSAEREIGERFLRELTRQTRFGAAFRGHVLSIEQDCHRQLAVRFHRLPTISRAELVLPEALLQRIERHTLSFSRNAERLRAAGRHLKRGILLHGPPGTGKTLSAMYIISQMPGRTALLLTGTAIGTIETACQLARMLAPVTVILEDVDLIGTERNHQTVGANALLFELLNQMDGLAEDTDILFILTTNRPDILEPALASRPGRIDQAIEVQPPDADCRRRLIELYSRGLQLKVTDWDRLIDRTAGVSGAFIRELLRKAAVFAAEAGDDGQLVVKDEHVSDALAELLVAGGPLTQSLLGAVRSTGSGER